MIQFPEKFQERMQQMLGDEEYAEFLKSAPELSMYSCRVHSPYFLNIPSYLSCKSDKE